MAETGTVAYMCECGKKWVIEKSALKHDSKWACKCGRTVVVHHGAIYTTAKK